MDFKGYNAARNNFIAEVTFKKYRRQRAQRHCSGELLVRNRSRTY